MEGYTRAQGKVYSGAADLAHVALAVKKGGARLGFEPGPLVEPDREGELIQGPGKTMSFPLPSARPSPLPHLPVLSWAPCHTVAYQRLPMQGLYKLI